MILSVHGGRITFECDHDGCHRSITIPQGAMDPPRIFELKGWQYVKSDKETRYYCPQHRD
jgi:hypothetical protein